MGDASAAAGWTAEDDVLLKSAVEAGASLESLAKGAVCFSHKFTLPELQDRWYSLLYDSETSAQASTRMAKFETELSASNPAKASKLFNPKAKCFSLFKRKIDSVKNYYYAMRKRIRHEPCLSADFFHSIAPCSCNPVDSGGCACGERHLLHKVDPSGSVVGGYGFTDGCGGRKHVHSNGNGQYTFDSEHSNSDGSMVIDGNTNHESPHGCSDVGKLYGCDDMQKISQTTGSNVLYTNNMSDATDQFDHGARGSKAPLGIHQDGVNLDQSSGNTTGRFPDPGAFKAISQKRCLQEPSVPTCSKVLGVKFDMLIDMQKIEGETLMLSDDKKMEINSIDALAYQANCDSVVCDSGLGRAMAPEGGFMHSQLKGFSQKEDLDLCSDLFPDCALETNKEDLGPHPLDTSNCDNRIDPIQKEPNVVDVSGVGSIPASSEVLYPEHNVKCMLNKEDSEIPVNDCIPIPGQTSLEPASTFDRDSQHDGRLVAKLINMENGQPSSPAPLVNLESAILEQNANMVPLKEGCAVGSELTPGLHGNFGGNNANTCTNSALHSVDGGEETTCGFTKHESCYDLQNLSFDKSIQVSNQMNCKFLAHKPRIGVCETAIQSCELASALPDKDFHDPFATISTMGQAEGSDNETSVPNYVDLEALILDLDLIPWDQESDFIQPEVSKFQYPESRKDLIRLEKGACSYMNRSIISKGAFAILYGQHMKYYMREPEVSLGRATEEVLVDIDLSKEGKANKISRRQAVIKMDDDGSFYITNTGKCSIFVNSKEVPCSKRISLMSDDSLIEIRNLKFIFHVNHKAARQYIARKRRESSSQGQNAAFDWSQNDP